MPLSRNEVAEYLALNADTLSRIMSRLVRENVLARSSRAQITIRDLDALKAHCPLSDAVTALHSTH
jgi:DNA-binding transcriptional regulator YhcF (GntR family)